MAINSSVNTHPPSIKRDIPGVSQPSRCTGLYRIPAGLGNDQQSKVSGRHVACAQIPEWRTAEKMGGLASPNSTMRHKGQDKLLLLQPIPSLDEDCLRDCKKNAFIIPQNTTARLCRVQACYLSCPCFNCTLSFLKELYFPGMIHSEFLGILPHGSEEESRGRAINS